MRTISVAARPPFRPRAVIALLVLFLWRASTAAGAAEAEPTRSPAASLTPSPAAQAGPAPAGPGLVIREQHGVARQAWPVTVGVPFPRGWLAGGAAPQVADDGGTLPSQSRILARWDDGSAKWVLIDLQLDLEKGARKILQLRRGRSPQPRARVRVTEGDDAIDVDTGPLRFQVAKRRFAVLQSVTVDGEAVPLDRMRAVLDSGGQSYTAAPPSAVTVEERGPLRSRIVVRGRYTNGFEYVFRIDAFAGQPFVRLQHTFVDTADRPYTMVDKIALELPVKLGSYGKYYAAVERERPESGSLPREGVRLVQTSNREFRTGRTERPGRLNGWFEAEGDTTAIGLDVPFFWQEYPQAVEIGPERLIYEMWAGETHAAKVGIGSAKTHDFFVVFGTRGRGRLRPGLLPQPGRGVVALADPSWTASTGALPNSVVPAHSRELLSETMSAFRRFVHSVARQQWDDSGQVQCPPAGKERTRRGFYGMLNWGDWNFQGYHDSTKGCDAWGNQEYDLTQALFLLFSATGDADVWTSLVAAARHFADVDIIHYLPEHPEWVGMNHPKNPLHFSFELGGVDPGHTWVEGLFHYYYLTGDERALEGALGIADYLRARRPAERKGNPRQFGWPALALATAFEATGDGRYRTAALEYARRGMQLHPVAEAAEHWKMGVLADGVAYVHAATADPDCRAWLLDYAKKVAEKQPKDLRFYPALAYVAKITGDATYRRIAVQALAGVKFGSWGKPFTIGTRTAFRIASLLGEMPPQAPAEHDTATPKAP